MAIENTHVQIRRGLINVEVRTRRTKDPRTTVSVANLMEKTGKETPHMWMTRVANAKNKEDKLAGCFLNFSANIRLYF